MNKITRDYTEHDVLYYKASEVDVAIEAQEAEIGRLKDDLQFVERWANHHGQKPHVTAQEALSCIQHYPPIRAITKSYSDGKVPTTFDSYSEIERLREALQQAMIVAKETHSHWDEDRDSKVGKLLFAMSGLNPGYDKRIDAIHAALTPKEKS